MINHLSGLLNSLPEHFQPTVPLEDLSPSVSIVTSYEEEIQPKRGSTPDVPTFCSSSDEFAKISMQNTFSALRHREWMENIDGSCHRFGKMVYDQGLHGSDIEPGFLKSALEGRAFIYSQLGTPTTSKMIKRLHKIMCSHFKGRETCTEISADKTGKYREAIAYITWEIHKNVTPLEKQTIEFIERLGLGHFEQSLTDTNLVTFHYACLTSEKVEALINSFLMTYNEEIAVATTTKEKLLAVTKFFKQYSWTHPFYDGSGRVNIMLLQKHLVECGLHSALLNSPYTLATADSKNQVACLQQGLKQWENIRMKITKFNDCRINSCRKILKETIYHPQPPNNVEALKGLS